MQDHKKSFLFILLIFGVAYGYHHYGRVSKRPPEVELDDYIAPVRKTKRVPASTSRAAAAPTAVAAAIRCGP